MASNPGSQLSALKTITSRYEVAIVASALPFGGRAWGSHVDEWRSWARELGFATEVILTDPGFGLDYNARLIGESLAANPHPNRLVVTYGQGTLEMRKLLELRLGRAVQDDSVAASRARLELEGLRAWISVAGAFGGATSSSLASKGWLAGLRAKVKLFLGGRPRRILEETATEAWLWKGDVPLPADCFVASVVGVPMASQVPHGLASSYFELARRGPNDGVLLLSEAVVQPSLVVPVQGMSHRVEAFRLKPILQRLLVQAVRIVEPAAFASSSEDKRRGPLRAADPGAMVGH